MDRSRERVRMEARSTPALPTLLLPTKKQCANLFDMTAFSWKSPEPTAVGACSSAVAVHVAESAVAQLFSLGLSMKHYIKLFFVIATLTAAAIVAFIFWAGDPFKAARFAPMGARTNVDALVIQEHWPHRLVDPEWVSRPVDLIKWSHVEFVVSNIIDCCYMDYYSYLVCYQTS